MYIYTHECIYIFCLSKLNLFISSLGMANAHRCELTTHSCTKGDISTEAQKSDSPTKSLSRQVSRQPRPQDRR